jgi:hypothetical protein
MMQNPDKITSGQMAALETVSENELVNIYNSLTQEQ